MLRMPFLNWQQRCDRGARMAEVREVRCRSCFAFFQNTGIARFCGEQTEGGYCGERIEPRGSSQYPGTAPPFTELRPPQRDPREEQHE